MKIRPGEWKVVLLLQLQIFLIIAVLLIAKPAGSALFLARFGSGALPYMFILTALVAGGVSTAYSSALKYYSILQVNLWSIAICIFSLLGFALATAMPGAKDVVAIGLYLWVALFGVLAASQFWLIANLVFDVRQAKRLFGPIGAGAIAGGIVGGYVANIVVKEFGFRPLLFVAGLLLLPTILITIYVWRKHIQGKVPKLARRRKRANLQESPYQIIVGSKHLMLLCGIVSLSVITAKLVDYQFSALALRRFANEEHLTAFFGFWFSTFNVIGLIIQLLFTHRIVKYLGISGALAFLPAGLTLGAVAMFFMPGLNTAIFSRLTDGSLKQSLHRAGVEMLFLPVSREVKGRIKTYIDVFIDSAAGGIGGLLLLLLVDGFGFMPAHISYLVFFLALGWLTCVILIRDEYLTAFRMQLESLVPDNQKKKSLKSKHKEVMDGFLKVLEDRESIDKEQQLLYVLERTESMEGEEFNERIGKLLNHQSERVRARAIRNLTLRHQTNLLDKILPMTSDTSDLVKNAAFEYLVSHFPKTARELIDEQLKHPDPLVSGSTFIALINERNNHRYIASTWDLPGLFQLKVEMLPAIFLAEDRKAWTLVLIRAAGKAPFAVARQFLAEQLESPNDEFRHAAIVAVGESLDERWLLRLIDFLSEAPDRPHARAALVQYGMGLIDLLPTYFRNDEIDIEDIRRLPVVMEGIESEKTVGLLFAMIDKYYPNDLETRIEAIRSLNAMQRDFSDLRIPPGPVYREIAREIKIYRLTLNSLNCQRMLIADCSGELREGRNRLITLLQQRHNNNMNRLFRLLGMRYGATDIIPIYRGMRSEDRSHRISALEFLDNLLDNSLKRMVIPVLEQETAIDHATPPEDGWSNLQYQQFRRILRGRDVRLKLATLHLMGWLEEDRYGKLLELYARADHLKIRNVALRSLELYRRRRLKAV
ncbi:hypothetical protein CEQ90_12585 [Lewinellaceae bacterium SD302]|nr:hypothetical protein CEQ90_12585 [Lewinellaceae bacterium SD302]